MNCDFCDMETDNLVSFPNNGFVYDFKNIHLYSPPSIWMACEFCTSCMKNEEKEVLLEHCVTSQCISEGLNLSEENINHVRNVLKPLHEAFFKSLGAPISN